ncbi:unnamed protein product [Clonostachys solani]|uniref:AA1-like domain-containing protein n=1 Tax=Clonostachys solani TaxID=160281 RepID=A0A9P0ERP3_9HYPO|nr:unnamed protein product [Clonostachys solani]
MNVILSSLLFLGSAVAAPASVELSAEELSCRNASRSILSWNIIDFDFHSSYTFSTPSHQIAGGYVNFTLENAALEYKPVCAASSSQLQDFFYGNAVYDCQVPPSAPRDAASFSFNRATGEVLVNQTWVCGDGGGKFTARGGTTFNLTCSDESWQNPDWKDGELYSTRNVSCAKVNGTASINQISGSTRVLS